MPTLREAGGHLGPPPLTLTRLLTAWTAPPGVVAAVLVAGVAYLVAAHRVRTAAAGWPGRRTACFLGGGLGSVLLVTVTVVGVYSDTLFWVRALQDIVLLMVTPMFLALGAPLRLVRELVPPPVRRGLGRVLTSGPARVATFPLVVTVVFVAPLFAVYLTPLDALRLRSPVISGLVGVLLVAAGFLYFWSRLRIDPTPRADPYGVTVWISIAEVVLDGALGLTLWLGPLVAAQHYQALGRGWGPSLRVDQIIGAGVLWIGGDLAGLPFLGAVFVRMMREDEQRAARIDAELDAADAATRSVPGPDRPGVDGAPAPGPVSASAPASASAPPPRLWWEDHPELAARFRRRG